MERFNSSRVPSNIRPLEHFSLYGLHQRPRPIARSGSAEIGRIFLVQIFGVVRYVTTDIRTTIIKKGISKYVKKGGSLPKEMGSGHRGKQVGG